MNTKTCKSCGKTNSVEAASCSNCRMNLDQVPVKSPPKGNMLYWIVGGIVTVVLFGGFFVVALSAGLYFYTRPTTTFEKPSETSANRLKETRIERIPFLNETIDSKHTVFGKFKLQKATRIDDGEKKVFKESKDEAFALYSTDQKKRPLEILFSVATFSSVDAAAASAAAVKKKLLDEKKGKILKESMLSDGVIITYKQNNLIGILDCEKKTCTRVTGIDGTKVADFYRLVGDIQF